MREFRLPKLSLSEDEPLTVVAWHVAEAAQVSASDVLLEVETDKAAMDIEAPFGGVIARIVLQPGAQAKPGDLAAWIADPGESFDLENLGAATGQTPASAPPASAKPGTQEAASARDVTAPAKPTAADSAKVAVAPSETVDWNLPGELRGFPRWIRQGNELPPGPLHAPVARNGAAAVLADEAGSFEATTLNRFRARIARSMTLAAMVPQFSVNRVVDVNGLQHQVQELKSAGIPATFTDMLLISVARSLKLVPEVNAWFEDEILFRFEPTNIALAVDSPRGVIAPVVRDVTAMSVAELVAERERLVTAARAGTLASNELSSATFTVSNVGPLGSDQVVPLVTVPQVAALGVGRFLDGQASRARLNATVVGDHRVLDGADGARLLDAFATVVEEGMPS